MGVWELVGILVLVLVILCVGRLAEFVGVVARGIRRVRRATTRPRAPKPTVAAAAVRGVPVARPAPAPPPARSAAPSATNAGSPVGSAQATSGVPGTSVTPGGTVPSGPSTGVPEPGNTGVPEAGGAAAPAVVVENKCPSCNTINPAGQAFCGQCGIRLARPA